MYAGVGCCITNNSSSVTYSGYSLGSWGQYITSSFTTYSQHAKSECCSTLIANSWYRNSTCCTSDASSTCCRYTWCGGACHSSCSYGCKDGVCCTSLSSEHCCKKNSKTWCGGSCHNSCSYGCHSGTCCSSNSSETCCKGNGKVWCGGSCHNSCSAGCHSGTCCGSVSDSSACCTGNGYSYHSGCCTSGANSSSACCTGINGSNYEYSGGSCQKKPDDISCSAALNLRGHDFCSSCYGADYGRYYIDGAATGPNNSTCQSRHPKFTISYTDFKYFATACGGTESTGGPQGAPSWVDYAWGVGVADIGGGCGAPSGKSVAKGANFYIRKPGSNSEFLGTCKAPNSGGECTISWTSKG